MTCGELDAASTAFAAPWSSVFARATASRLLPNCPQFLIAEVGTWKIGAVVVAVNPTYTERELEGMLDATRAKTIITLTPFYERVKHVQGPGLRAGDRHVNQGVSARRSARVVHDPQGEERRTSHPARRRRFVDGRSDSRARRLGPTVCVRRPDDPAVILSSGGTTGTPKGVVGLHRHYVAAGRSCSQVDQVGEETVGRTSSCCHCLSSTCTRNVGVQPMAFLGPNPLSLVPNPRDIDDLLEPSTQSSRRFSTACRRSTQRSSTIRKCAREDRPELDQVVLLGFRRPDG